MNVLNVYLRIYSDAFRQALAGLRKNAWTMLLPMALLTANGLLTGLMLGLGIVGQLLVWIVWAAAASCYLYFLGEVVGKSRVRLDEFGQSIKAYFWSVANLLFVFWVASLVVQYGVPASQQGLATRLLTLAVLILLNAAPEVIYQRGTYGGLETIQRSIRFLQENWIEWGIPNLLILAAWWFFPPRPLWARPAGSRPGGSDRGRPPPCGDGLPGAPLRRARRHEPPAADVSLALDGFALSGSERSLRRP